MIVTDVDKAVNKIVYDSRGETQTANLQNFLDAWNGIALLAFPQADSREPDYSSHYLIEVIKAGSATLVIIRACISNA